MPVLVKVSQNNNDKTTAFGKWYGRVVNTKTMSYSELCKHMSEHNFVYGEDVCLGVANKLQNCILEQLLEGKKVQFGELGTFYLSVKSSGTVKESDFNLGSNIQGLFLCFAPSRTDVNNLSSKMLKKKASFMKVKDLIEAKSKNTSNENQNENENQGESGNENQNQNENTVTVAAPQFSGETQFTETTQVSMSAESGAEIRYTLDGSTPTSSSTLYSAPVTLSDTTTVKAIAIKGGVSSSVTSRTYTKTSGGDNGGGGTEN